MKPDENMNTVLNCRVSKAVKDGFNKRCEALKKSPAEMLRDLAVAFTENRVTINISDDQKANLKEIYNVN